MNLSDENQYCSVRGVKNPGWPISSAVNALAFCCQRAGDPTSADGQRLLWAVIPSQKLRRHFSRFSGALPAMMAALIAPIEIPATQSGRYSDDAGASYTPACWLHGAPPPGRTSATS